MTEKETFFFFVITIELTRLIHFIKSNLYQNNCFQMLIVNSFTVHIIGSTRDVQR